MHFTYADQPDKTQLYQGDVIVRDAEIDSILEEVHPHYRKKDDYKAFIVLTQTCDLVRRDGKACSARYISIAAVRPLELVLTRSFASYCPHSWESEFRISSQKIREKVRLFLERLLNNNEDEYFFLYREPEFGLPTDSCAFLQLSIAVKSELHYEKLLGAKRLQLTETFQHKLGYLVGKMYSRIGTPDWVPSKFSDEKLFDQHVNQLIKDLEFALWLPDDIHKALVARVAQNNGTPVNREILLKWAEDCRTEKNKRKQTTFDAIEGALKEAGVTEGVARKAIARISNLAAVQVLFK